MLSQSLLNDVTRTSVWISAFILFWSYTLPCVHVSPADTKQNSLTLQAEDGGSVRVIREAQMEFSAQRDDALQNKNRHVLLKALRAKLCKESKQGKKTETNTSLIKTRIVGGHDAKQHEFPHQVLLSDFNGQPVCGGTIYNEYYIITAAHCFTRNLLGFMPIVGVHNVGIQNGNEQILSISRTKLHEGYDGRTFNNDIALIQVTSRMKFSKFIQPAQLPTKFTERTGSATVTGWGVLQSHGTKKPDILQKVSVPLITNERCKTAYPNLPDTKICAGDVENGGIDSCQGDSGGPLSVKNSDGTYTVIGVVSSGIDCASPQYPGLYTDVFSYTDWIKKNAK